ncbi:MAG: outer membrane lipoprotein-sorting protein [Thermodesulfovibrionales bacterium]
MNKLAVLLSVLCMITVFSGSSSALTPGEILTKADDVRSAPYSSFVMDVDLTSPQGNMSFKVYSRAGAGSLAMFVKPAAQKGQLLFMQGDTFMFFAPGTHQPTRIHPTQRLKGDISNGDLLRLRWSQDYDAKQISADGKTYELELTAKNRAATYSRLEVLIEKNSFKPVQAKVYLQSGKLYKTILFTDFRTIAGKLMATELTFVDHLKNGKESKMTFSKIQQQEIPDNYFDSAALPALSKSLAEK